MPNRFRSLRGRQTDAKTAVIDPPEYFDFDFRAGLSRSPVGSTSPRPNTAAGHRTVPQVNTEDRPRTADRPVNRRLDTAKVENDCIGLAIGSPTHAPTSWTDCLSPLSPQHAFRHEGPFPHYQASTWKKIGGMFKPRTSSLKYEPSPVTPNEPTSSPLSKSMVSGDGGDPAIEPMQKVVRPTLPQKQSSNTVGGNCNEVSSTPAALPKLEIEIPRIEMERYSVMFKDIMGPSSTKMLLRKSKAPHDLKVSTTDIHESQPLPSPRRVTNPSLSKFQYQPFPPSTHPLKQNPSQDDQPQEDHQTRQRSVSSPVIPDAALMRLPSTRYNDKTAPNPSLQHSTLSATTFLTQPFIAELPTTRSPIESQTDSTSTRADRKIHHRRTETANSAKPKPLVTRRLPSLNTQPSPDDAGLSDKEETPRRSTDSLQSSTSSNTTVEDIFFDLKPIRDATGVRESQYVVINPDADAVQLARSISLKNKKRYQEAGSSPDIYRYEWTPEMFADPWGLPPDLQAAEHFCMSSDKQVAQPALRLSMFDKAIEEVEKFASPYDHGNGLSSQNSTTSTRYIQVPSKTKGLAIGIPSPITERSCEGTPRTTPVVENRPLLPPRKLHIAAQASSSPTIIVSGLSSNFDMPPPVPRKDSKFLAKGNSVAKADKASSSGRKDGSPGHSRPGRKPVAARHDADHQSRSYEHKNNSSRRRRDPDQDSASKATILMAAKPRAELSVARSVSLTRKSSHKVFVKRQGGSDSRIGRGVQAY